MSARDKRSDAHADRSPVVAPDALPHGGGSGTGNNGGGNGTASSWWVFTYGGVFDEGQGTRQSVIASTPGATINAGPFGSLSAATAWADNHSPTGSGGSGNGGGGSGGGNGRGGKFGASSIEQLGEWMVDQVGHCYVYGGAPGPDFRGCVDCSSYCNYGWGVVAGQAIPGYAAGEYTGAEHGPSTVTWLAAQGTVCGSVNRDDAQLGDLAVWPTHMGFIIDSERMVSAQNPTDGIQISGIDGFIPGEPLTILRLSVVGPGGISFPVGGLADQSQISGLIREIAQQSRTMVGVTMAVNATLPQRGGL